MRLRLRPVAELAGVSEATVSRVLNGRPHVAARTRAIVLDAVRSLGGPVPGARRPGRAGGVVTPVGGLVAIVMPELDNPVFPEMAQLVSARLATTGLLTIVARCGTEADEAAMREALAETGAAAMVLVSAAHADVSSEMSGYRLLLGAGVPMVFVNGYRRGVDAPFVSCDDRHAAALAVGHLAGLGHRRIGFLSGPQRYTVVQRKLAGYRAALEAAGITPDDRLVVETLFTAEAGHAAARPLIEAGATAVVAASDLLALGAIRGAREHGLDVPREWSITGFDDSALMAYTDPPLTTVRQPLRAICHAAADLVVDQLAGRPTRVGELLFRPELVVRASTAPARPPGASRRRRASGSSTSRPGRAGGSR